MPESNETILVLDFGSQYSQLIARRIRECNVFSKVVPCSISAEEIRRERPQGIVLSGGPASVYEKNAPRLDPEILQLGVPVLGICYGMQLIIQTLGGEVVPGQAREYGRAPIHIVDSNGLFEGVPSTFNVWMSHGDKVSVVPPNVKTLAVTANTEFAAIQIGDRPTFGIQFHPEVVHCEYGTQILFNFCRNVCRTNGTWTMESFIEESVREIREKVGDSGVILGLSGGVDSSVAAALIHKAIGEQLTCIFVDNGLLRKNEAQSVQRLFGDSFQMNLTTIDASERFLQKLQGIEEPEAKRKIIGKEFVEVFNDATANVENADFLAQGTTYPDVIESVSINGNPSAVIKSHHNVGGLPKNMKFKLLEPLSRLFKDEVREVGRRLGLPDYVVDRQPFPGPGLAVRHLGAVAKPTLDILREADAIIVEEIKNADLYYKIWQTFAIFVPMRTVGVMGDLRTYDYIIALRAVESQDGMTADWVDLPHWLLQKISSRIINEVRGVNRVVYDITSKPPGTIEWE